MTAPTLSRWAPPAVAGVALLVLWELAAQAGSSAATGIAPVSAVAAQIVSDAPLLWTATLSTLWVATRGLLGAAAVATAIALVFVHLPAVERGLQRTAVVLYCVPLVAVAPVLQVVAPGDLPQVLVSAIAVFFPMLVMATLGFRSADGNALAVVRSEGGGAWAQTRLVKLRAAVPALLVGLRLAVPAALLGGLIGEFIGAQRGLGVLLVQALSTYETERAWAVAVVIALLSGLAFVAVTALSRTLAPWEGTTATSVAWGEPAGARTRLGRLMSAAGSLLASLAVLLLVWVGGIRLFGLSPYVAKTPADLWRDFVVSPDAQSRRDVVLAALAESVFDSGLGYLAGIVLGILAALAFTAWPLIGRALSPIAVAVYSVPIIVLLPLMILMLGRGVLTTVAVAALVSFLPVLTNAVAAMRDAPGPAIDFYRSMSAGVAVELFRIRLPHAVPQIFAAARIAIPIAVTGALLAEWLATGRGLGYLVFSAGAQAQYSLVWGGSVALTAVSLCAYVLIAGLERAAIRRFAPAYSRSLS